MILLLFSNNNELKKIKEVTMKNNSQIKYLEKDLFKNLSNIVSI